MSCVPVEAKAAKDEKHVANAQLVWKKQHVMTMLERKVKTQCDEFLFKIFSMNGESAEAKKVIFHEGTRSNGGYRCCDWETSSQKEDILEFSSSAEVDVSTSSSASTDDESILATEQLDF